MLFMLCCCNICNGLPFWCFPSSLHPPEHCTNGAQERRTQYITAGNNDYLEASSLHHSGPWENWMEKRKILFSCGIANCLFFLFSIFVVCSSDAQVGIPRGRLLAPPVRDHRLPALRHSVLGRGPRRPGAMQHGASRSYSQKLIACTSSVWSHLN